MFKVLALKNDVNLLQIKSKNQEDIINIMKREIDDLNLVHANETEKTNKELANNQSLMNHYKGNILKMNAKYLYLIS